MKGKKIFPNKNTSNIFFIQQPQQHTDTSFPKTKTQSNINTTKKVNPLHTFNLISPKTQRTTRSTEHNNTQIQIQIQQQQQQAKTSFKRRNFSIDDSETKLRDKITSKIKKVEPDIAKFRKKKENISFLFSEKYYQKFVNKQPNNYNNRNALKSKNLGTVTYEISKTKNDNKEIDTADVKRSFTRNGINMIKVRNSSSGMTHINNDKITFSLQEDDVRSNKFEQIKKTLIHKGLKITQKSKENYDKEISTGIFPAKSQWMDAASLSKRDVVERKKIDEMKTKRSMSCESNKKCFNKKST
jgi:hypothetical protein